MPFTVPRAAGDAQVIADIPGGRPRTRLLPQHRGLLWLIFGGLLFLGLPLLDRIRKARRRDAEAAADVRGELSILAAQLRRLQTERECSRQTTAQMLAQLDRVTQLVERALPGGAACAKPDSRLGSSAALAVLRSVRDSRSLEDRAAAAVAPAGATSDSGTETALGHDAAKPADGSTVDGDDGSTGGRAPEMPAGEPGTAAPTLPADAWATATGDLTADRDAVVASGGCADKVASGAGGIAADPVAAGIGRSDWDDRAVIAGAGLAIQQSAPRPAPRARPESAVACDRWDAPPRVAPLGAVGWGAPPTVMHSGRFRRPGRLVAASGGAHGGVGVESACSRKQEWRQMAQDERGNRGLVAKWRGRRQRKAEQELERAGKRPATHIKDQFSLDQTEQAVRSIPSSSGGLIG